MVYFIGNEDFVKIGYSKDFNTLKQRFIVLQCGSPFTLELFLVISGDFKKEKEFHYDFKDYRTSGEWFVNSNLIKNFIKEHEEYSLVKKTNLNCEIITLKDLRKANKFSLKNVGEIINMTPQSVKETEDRFLNGSITLKSLKNYANAIGYNVSITFSKNEK